MGVRPLNRKKVEKKHTIKVQRFQSQRFMRVASSWRKPVGIDGRVRRRFRGTLSMPTIGRRNDRRTRNYSKDGFKTFLISNPGDLELLLMNNRTYKGEIAQNISKRKRAQIVQRAKELNVGLTNGSAKLVAKPSE